MSILLTSDHFQSLSSRLHDRLPTALYYIITMSRLVFELAVPIVASFSEYHGWRTKYFSLQIYYVRSIKNNLYKTTKRGPPAHPLPYFL